MENIAIVGIANLFPGSSAPEEFWQQLLEKQDNRTAITEHELGVNPDQYLGKKGENDKYYCLYGGYIRDFEFNAQEYLNVEQSDFNSNDLLQLDDLHHWSLYVTKRALQDAGYWQAEQLKQCGLILGNLSFPTKQSNHLFMESYRQVVELALQHTIHPNFALSAFAEQQKVNPHNALVAGYPAALLAQVNGLGGQYFALDAACASSCYSVKLACDHLHSGKADMMLAGAVSAADSLFVNMGFSIFQAFPENNRHAPFDKDSQGLFAAQGAGMMVLKRHSDAIRDGDKIHAVIKGGALTNDGKGEFVLSPNSKGQVLAYQEAYHNAQVDPKQVDYIECHATGTPKGDKVELSSMEQFFSEYQHKPLLGSAKSNLGHLLTAAGMPGMTKAIYALNNGQIPATINVDNAISTQQGYFSAAQIPTETINWPESEQQRTAGVSVFGFGGSNAHLVLQPGNSEYVENTQAINQVRKLAIVGMDCHFGKLDSMLAYQQAINNKQHCFSALPTHRWQGIEQQTSVLNNLGLNCAPKGNYISEFDIDFLRFKIPPNEQDSLIAQQLLMMKVADNAARDAGLKAGGKVAVLVAMGLELDLHQYRGRVNLATQIENSLVEMGIELSEQQQAQLIDISKQSINDPAQLNQYTSFIGNIMASRISALWDFSGPAFTVSSEENSVYKCIDIADNLLKSSDLEGVIIASVDLAGSFENISLRQQFLPVSEQAQVAATPDQQIQWLVGEGAGAFVVKADNKVKSEQVYGNIEACLFANQTELVHQIKLISSTLQSANLNAHDISQVESFAVGSKQQLSVEQASLQQVYPDAKLVSSKQYVGHCYNASGMASLLSSVIALHNTQIQPTSKQANQYVAVHGLGQDMSVAHLILSNVHSQKAIAALPQATTKLSLIKTVTLGGKSIFNAIHELKEDAKLETVQQSFNKHFTDTRTPVSEPLNRSEIAQHSAVNHSPVTDNRQEAAMNKKHMTQQAEQVTYTQVSEQITQQHQTHQAFLRQRFMAEKQIATLIKLQSELALGNTQEVSLDESVANKDLQLNTLNTNANKQSQMQPTPQQPGLIEIKGQSGYHYSPLQLTEQYNQPEQLIFDTAQLVEFAEGEIGNVFGEQYRVIDSYSRRVRLPTTDYLLVSRVTDLQASTHQYKKSSMTTEYDIPMDAPFLIDGQIPWSVSVESGQCDLMLISYIGIDFQNKGERVYRLLDCELTFLEEMAFGGETLRYEIHIDSYAKNGEQLLFFFHYDCYVGDKKVLIMRNGCAGFFTDEELADGKGVISTANDQAQLDKAQKSCFTPLINNQQTQYNYQDMLKLVDGDIAGCFGQNYDQQGRNPSLKFSSEKFLMIERVTKIDPQGGHWGLGLLEGQKTLAPDHWYFPCHFKDDQVMAGSLMSEGCGQMAMFFMLWLGMNSEVNNARFQPMPGEAQTVRCRGQVRPQHNTLTYRMEVTAIGMSPRPFIKANIDIILDGKVVVDFKNLCVEIKEQDQNSPFPVTLPESVQQLKANAGNCVVSHSDVGLLDERGINPFAHIKRPLMRVESDLSAPTNKGVVPIKHFPAPFVEQQNRIPDTTPFTPWHLFEFATGDISQCFGPDFSVYQGRTPPRTPCGDLQVVTQVTEVQGQRMDFKTPSSCVAEYVVPEDAWYFTKNSAKNWMPYSLLMEIALQPNGFISAYMGTTLKYPEKDLYFRNLDGHGEIVNSIDLRGKTIVNKSVLLSTSMAGGAIIQSFSFELSVAGQCIYRGGAVFGYFSADSLTNQLGIDNGQITAPWFVTHNTPATQLTQLDLTNKALNLFAVDPAKPAYRLAGGQLNFVDQVTIVEGGGDHQLAYVYGQRTIDASDWFFRYHFHQDPVMPGSLGVEAIIELLQCYALKNDLGQQFTNPRFIAPETKVAWKYRGQITPLNKQMSLDIHIKEIIKNESEVRIIGDANLSKDGLRIYQVEDIVLSIIEA
ncbi:3-hydroxyacyl-[acyl-carrier-protein] dehydratase FabA [Psychromonas sp. B3M02]|uniref:hotdog fold thioesterase n=1 Tax=Psychromonas sp. B3M02 TaxID=2267226 RepID=UPI000DE9E069|nr:beta-ketoacyl synthase N-terminal-like domain-containing protein [Psychromonas sp. B3M02]RBW45733.1 3-hydroxyacyl-[acyl-carrier-protein] dehydratase FabA [Psychromonas sp. B3M02]